MKHIEPVTNGVVTSRVPDLLAEGELVVCSNAVHVPSHDGLVGRPFRGGVLAAVSTGTAYGMASAVFQNGDTYLLTSSVAAAGGAIGAHKITDAASGTAITLTSTAYAYGTGTTVGSYLSAIPYQNKYYILDGANRNLVYPNSTMRTHGLAPVTGNLTVSTAAGNWSASATGYFDYWLTEALETGEFSSTNPLESTFVGTPTTVQVTSTSTSVTLAMPVGTPANTSATHFYVYRTEAKPTIDTKLFPIGKRVGRVPITQSTWVDGVASQYPAATATFALPTATAGATGWTNPNNTFANDGSVATASVILGTSATIDLKGFFGASPTPQEPINGLVVRTNVWGSNLNYAVAVLLSDDAGATWTAAKTCAPSTTATDASTFDMPAVWSTNDTWGKVWTTTKLNDSNFRIRFVVYGTSLTTAATVSLDWVGVKAFYNGTPVVGTIPFPAVIIDEGGGATSGVGANNRAPISSTGDVFNGSLVLNDVSNPNRVVWSIPTKPEYFPELYRDDLETSRTVTNIKTVNNRLVVCTTSAKWRYNYLPSQLDAQFTTGRAREAISLQNGCINPQCAALVQNESGNALLAVAGYNGIFATDGYSDIEWTSDFDWSGYFVGKDWTTMHPVLVNNPQLWELTFIYRYTSTQTLALKLHYHPRHMKNGRPKITGPHEYNNTANSSPGMVASAVVVPLSSGNHASYLLYDTGNSLTNNRVFIESFTYSPQDDTYPDNQSQLPTLTTRRIYFNGLGGEWMAGNIHVLRPTTPTASLDITPTTYKTNSASTTHSTKTIAGVASAPLARANFRLGGESLQLTVAQTSNTAGFNIEALLVDVDQGPGSEDSAK